MKRDDSIYILIVGLTIVAVLASCHAGDPTFTLLPSNAPQFSSEHGRLALITVSENQEQRVHNTYLFDPQERNMALLGRGNGVLWSPSGSYLAVLNIPAGPIYSFSIWNPDTLDHTEQTMGKGSFLLWAADESHIVAGWADQYGCKCFMLLSGDGTDILFNPRCGCLGGLGSVGHRFLGWQKENLLVEVRKGAAGPTVPQGPNGVYLFDPQNTTWTLIEPLKEHNWSQSQSVETHNWVQHTDDSAFSADGALLASYQSGQLVVQEISSGQSFTTSLPSEVIDIQALSWSP